MKQGCEQRPLEQGGMSADLFRIDGRAVCTEN
jgi:hypothetical protein